MLADIIPVMAVGPSSLLIARSSKVIHGDPGTHHEMGMVFVIAHPLMIPRTIWLSLRETVWFWCA
jgi:hypothetical protein